MTRLDVPGTLDVRTEAGGLVVSAELTEDAAALVAAMRRHDDLLLAAFDELSLDWTYGRDTRHHPNRSDLYVLQRPERVRRNIRRNLEWAGLGGARFGRFTPSTPYSEETP